MKSFIKLITLTMLCFYAPLTFAERTRFALVIGNADYVAGQLRNPANDARAISATLRELGFQVTELENASQEEMEQAINQFGRSLNQNTVGLFYFSGHGVQHNGQNYLIPIGAMGKVNTADQLRYKTVNAGFVLDTMKQSGSGLNFFFLDACRSTPFKRFTRDVSQGLAKINNAQGTLISFATAPGTVAYDGNGQNSPYTTSLLKWMKKPDLPIELMLKGVRSDVKKRTDGKQSPWYEASIDGHFSFNTTGKDIIVQTSTIQSNTSNSVVFYTPSFNCAKARTPTEYAICESPELARLDKEMAAVFFSKYSSLNSPQKQWIKERDQCGNTKQCLIYAYKRRITELKNEHTVQPSFDCSQASKPVEQAICQSDELSRLDNQMNKLFNQKAQTQQLKDTQLKWWLLRNQCGRNVDCIRVAYSSRIHELLNW